MSDVNADLRAEVNQLKKAERERRSAEAAAVFEKSRQLENAALRRERNILSGRAPDEGEAANASPAKTPPPPTSKSKSAEGGDD